MSGDYIAQLLALATGRAAVVEPRQPQRFEPENGVADPLAAAVIEEPAASAAPLSMAQSSAATAAPVVPPAMRNDAPAMMRHRMADKQPDAPAAVLPDRAVRATSPIADVTPPAMSAPQSRPDPAPAPIAAAMPPDATMEPGKQAPSEPAPHGHPPPPSPVRPTTPARPGLPTGARPVQAQPSGPAPRIIPHTAPSEPIAAPPAITVRIDRIDIHAPAPPPPPRAAPAHATTAPTGLAAYLARRREGGW